MPAWSPSLKQGLLEEGLCAHHVFISGPSSDSSFAAATGEIPLNISRLNVPPASVQEALA